MRTARARTRTRGTAPHVAGIVAAVPALDPRTLAAYAHEIARAFGLDATVIAEPRNERQAAALVAGLHARLRHVRPVASAGSIGEVLDALAACARTGGPERRARR